MSKLYLKSVTEILIRDSTEKVSLSSIIVIPARILIVHFSLFFCLIRLQNLNSRIINCFPFEITKNCGIFQRCNKAARTLALITAHDLLDFIAEKWRSGSKACEHFSPTATWPIFTDS